MNRGSLARRYAPLLAVVAIQLLIVAVVPSKAPTVTAATSGAPAAAGTGAADTAVGPDAGLSGDTSALGGTSGVTGGSVGGATKVPGVGGPGGGGATAVAGDISHCVEGRQFAPSLDYWAPPCVGKFVGKNPGATYQGVSADTVTIVDYRDLGNQAVNQLLIASGGYTYPEDQKAFDAVAEKFINSHYELYGRKVKIEYVEGKCTSVPPDVQCLRQEMDEIVNKYHPFMFRWATTLCSACYDELSRLKTVNIGGFYFRDSFSQARRPYHWDVQESGTRLAQQAGELWCKQMAPYKARYGGTDNSQDNNNGKPRVLGVISTDDADNKAMVETDLKNALAKCGAKYEHTYFYAQDISTAETQRKAAVTAMHQDPESTTVLCLCDEVAPQFLYEEEREEQYYPENLLGGTGFMDGDTAGQSYDSTLCVQYPGGNCHEFENAFGISTIDKEEPRGTNSAVRVWKATGIPGGPPDRYTHPERDWDYYNMMASMLQAGGPTLTPLNMEAGVFKAGFRGGSTTGRIKRGFAPGSYAWNQDARIVYWSPNKVSAFNGLPGTFVQVGPSRFDLGAYPSAELSSIPPKPR